ncbi:MAG: alanine dehydrogenase [Spirosomataceae bacterium]
MPAPLSDMPMLAETGLLTKELPAKLGGKGSSITIGLPKEVSLQENRIALTPDAVGLLIHHGFRVRIEKGAGLGAQFTDNQYLLAGGEIVGSPEEVFDSEIILKIEPLIESEFNLLKPGKAIFSTLNFPALTKSYFERLLEKRVIGVAFETLEDKVGNLPVIRAMSEIAGNAALLLAAEFLSSAHGGRGVLMGGVTGVPPTSIVILGAGTVAEYATRAAIGLGAEVKVFDSQIYRLQRLKYAVGQHVHTSILDTQLLSHAIQQADVVIGALRAENGISPCVVTEEMVASMRPGSLIIDVSIDQGGCFETSEMTTHQHPTFVKHGIIHYGVPNIPSRVAHTASIALSNIFTPMLLKMGRMGSIEEMIYNTPWFNQGIYCYKGHMTHEVMAKRFSLRYRDIALLLAARL